MIIGRLRGTVAALGADSVMIDVNGVGYVALAGSRLLSRLTVGAEAEVFIETRVTENSITLFAFHSDEERAWFVRLQDVPGVAGKSAMAIMDAISASELMDALALGEEHDRAVMRATAQIVGEEAPRQSYRTDGIAAVGALVSSGKSDALTTGSLTQPAGFQGVNGVFRFLPDGTNARALAVATIEAKQVVVLSPAPTSFGAPGL